MRRTSPVGEHVGPAVAGRQLDAQTGPGRVARLHGRELTAAPPRRRRSRARSGARGAHRIVVGGARGRGTLQAHRPRAPLGRRIERVGDAAQDDEGVELEAQRHRVAGPGVVRDERERPVVVDGDLAEEVDVGDEVAPAEAVLGQLDEQAVARAAAPVVAVLRVRRDAPALGDMATCVPGDRVVPAARVGRDRGEDPPHVGVERDAGTQAAHPLALQRVGHAVALERVVGAVQQGRDVRAALRSVRVSAVPRRQIRDQLAPGGRISSRNGALMPWSSSQPIARASSPDCPMAVGPAVQRRVGRLAGAPGRGPARRALARPDPARRAPTRRGAPRAAPAPRPRLMTDSCA